MIGYQLVVVQGGEISQKMGRDPRSVNIGSPFPQNSLSRIVQRLEEEWVESRKYVDIRSRPPFEVSFSRSL
jgi:hypothetical protein